MWRMWNSISVELMDLTEVVEEITSHSLSNVAGWLLNAGEMVTAKRQLSRAVTWKDWKRWARRIDELRGGERWKHSDASELYDYKLLRRRKKVI